MDHFNHKQLGSLLMNHTGFSKKRVAYDVALKGKKQIAEGTMAFSFEKPKQFVFKAGQHVRVTLIDPPETDNRGNRRFFSLANHPGTTDLVLAMRMGPSAFKRNLESMPLGNKIRIEMLVDNPHSSFTLHDNSTIPAVFLVGGIGIVPAFSIIKDWAEKKLKHQIFLFYSNRRPEDAPYLEALENLAKQNPSFKLIATMTELEKSAKTWQGETGKIDKSMLKKYVSDFESPIYYTAGLPEMVDAMRRLLTSIGIKEDRIHAEEFSGFKMSLKDDDAYTCPMHPEVVAAEPDNCPKCGMALVPNKDAGSKDHNIPKTHLLLLVIGVVIVVLVIVHTGFNPLQFHSQLLSFNSPFSYLTIGLILAFVAFKVFMVLRIKTLLQAKKGKGKLSAWDILKAHNPIQKK